MEAKLCSGSAMDARCPQGGHTKANTGVMGGPSVLPGLYCFSKTSTISGDDCLTEGSDTSSVENNGTESGQEGSNGNVSAGDEGVRSGYEGGGCDGDKGNEID